MKYGLIGKNFASNFSCRIHEDFGNGDYIIRSILSSELDLFMKEKNFLGINVTMPYKKDVIPYLDYVSDYVLETQSCNTIINDKGKLIGFNTDYDGLLYLLKRNHIKLKDKIIGILGAGGSSATIVKLACDLGAKKIVVATRHVMKHPGSISYQELENQGHDIQVLFNATPFSNYLEKNDLPFIDLNNFPSLKIFIDLNYRQKNTDWMVNAKKLNIQVVNGLEMLVEQARVAEEIFFDGNISPKYNEEIIYNIRRENLNIALIGMPFAGKSTIGFQLSKELHKAFIDVDLYIEELHGQSISEIFEKGTEEFRNYETNAIKQVTLFNNTVFAFGGGAVLDQRNIDYLRRNSIIIWIKRPVEKIVFDHNRPLCKNINDYENLYETREKLYKKYADYVVDNDSDISTVVERIKKFYDESISN